MLQAVNIVRAFRPHVAFTSGGYVAVPAGLAARLNSVPLLLHQQDVPPNLSNRLVAPLATRISVAFADSLAYFPARKTLQLGNPIRQAMLDVRQVLTQEARGTLGFEKDIPLLLVTGGSQGARHLNQVVCQALPDLLAYCQVLQISGKELYNETRELSKSVLANQDETTRKRYRLVAYLNAEMPMALQAADLVLCRSGASTLSELAALGKPSILVPLPPAIGSSPQEANAAMFGREQAAEVIKDSDLKPQILVERIKYAVASNILIESMANAARSFAKPLATREIAAEIVKIAKVK
jgi:UDP-N-acetylglucosamine--N-acetylmuramyl-(pentapeptide) pyrophosphoryl-undecaprenol N-acetylglucosamine transferase